MKTLLRLLACALALALSARAEDLAIIVAKNVAVDRVALPELRQLLRAEKSKTPDGLDVTLVTRERGSVERATVLREIYQLPDAGYEKYFMQKVFTGAMAAAPRLLPTANAMRKFVAANPGAIGYIRASDLDDSVKVLAVDGVLPGAAGYPLHLPGA